MKNKTGKKVNKKKEKSRLLKELDDLIADKRVSKPDKDFLKWVKSRVHFYYDD